MSNDDGIREVHGLAKTATKDAVQVFEYEDGKSIGLVSNRYLTVAQARHIANSLYRLADRTEERLRAKV